MDGYGKISRVDAAILVAVVAMAVAVAVPRHWQMASSQRQDEVAALAQGMTSTTALAHARWSAAGGPLTLATPRGKVAMVHGYPSVATLPLLFEPSEVAAFRHAAGRWQHAGTDGPCGVRYGAPAAPGERPAIVVDASGC